MEIVYHVGVHCTDEGQIFQCLNRNRRLLAQEGIVIAHPGKFRTLIRETLNFLKGAPAGPEIQEGILDAVLTEDDPTRIVFSNDAFLAGWPRILDHGRLYPEAGEKCLRLRYLFPDSPTTICIGIRNPATFLPACFARQPEDDFAAFISRFDPLDLRWSEVIGRIRLALPEDVVIKVWSNEDTPFIWPELMREISGHAPETRLSALDDFLASIMMPEGLERMQAYLETHPPANEAQRRRVLDAFLDKFEIEDETLDVEAPGWDAEYLNALTDIYEEDLFEIERIQGVRFISP